MIKTIVLSIIMMIGLFMLLWSEVGFIQDKRYASSCPKEELEVMPDRKPERFKGQYALGWCMALFSFILMTGAVIYGGYDGIKNHFTFRQFYIRFVTMLFMLKVFDIIFFDWFLLCNKGLNFFTHYYPEAKDILGPHLFGYNWKTHLFLFILVFILSAAIAWLCMLF